jgi:alkanesulfonate monooxygenase SsuD/methylene tetrahydromethanopterin reductase-like flavin-dependent oxidoreductase (luciferase family)
MEFGVFHLMPVAPWTTEEETISRELDSMIFADELGFDEIWLAEHGGSDYGIIGSAALILAALATRTKNARLGTAVSVLPLHNPLRVAEEYAFIDQLSGGRLDLGVGRGYQPSEFARYGLNVSENRPRFQEALEIIKEAWTSEGEFEYDGTFYQITPTLVHPKPIQKPHPPLWIATGSIETMEWAGRQLIPYMAAPLLPHSVLNSRRDAFVNAAVEYGHPKDEAKRVADSFWLLKNVFVADSDQEARDACERSVMWYFEELNCRRMFEAPAEEQPYEYYLEGGGFFWGTPDRVTEQIKQCAEETSASRIICWFDHGGMDRAAVTKSLKLFAEKVMPNFK